MKRIVFAAILAASSVASASNINLGKIAPWNESPFTNLWHNNNGPRDDGFVYLDLHQPGPVISTWDGPDDAVTVEHLVGEPNRVKVGLGSGVSNLWIAYANEANEGFFRQPFLKALMPFDTLRMLEWTSANTSTVQNWADRPTLNDGWGFGRNGVPPEVIAELANQTGKNLWLPIPATSTVDYQTELASFLANQLDPDVHLLIEYGNEVWNPDFPNNSTAADYKAKSEQLFDIFENAMGDDRVTSVQGGQAVSPGWIQEAKSPDMEAMAIGAYARIEPPQMDLIYNLWQFDQPVDWLVFSLLETSVHVRRPFWQEHANMAEDLGVPLMAYEAGVNLTAGHLSGDAEFEEWLSSLHDDPRMGDVFRLIGDVWDDIGGDDIYWYKMHGEGSFGMRKGFEGGSVKWDAVISIPGDANRDWLFNSQDIIQVFQAGLYETGETATWATGDWTGDSLFDSSDLIYAFQAGYYENPNHVVEPEANRLMFALGSFFGVLLFRRQLNHGCDLG